MQWVRLGDYIEQCDERNATNCNYPVIGINKDKEFMPTVANTDEIDLKKYKIIRPEQFIFSGMQTGRDVCIRIGLYDGETALISPAYTTFVIKKPDILLPEFVFMYFKRSEMDRNGWFISDSSVRSNLDWPRFLDIEIPLPSIDEQKQVVAAWRGLKNLSEQNEQMAAPLMDLCQSYLQDLKHKYPLVEIGPFIEEINERNNDDKYDQSVLRGVTNGNKFDNSKAITDGLSFTNYKIVKKDYFAYNPSRINIGSIAKNQDDVCIISPMYVVFKIKDVALQELLPDFLMAWFTRAEFQRSTLFYAVGSVRDTFSFAEMCRVKIPLPPIEIQRAIAEIYNCAKTSKFISERAKKLNSEICPALMRQIIGDNQ